MAVSSVRWDRVSVLLALIAVLAVAVGHAVSPGQPMAPQVAAIVPGQPPPEAPAATVLSSCPPAAKRAIRTAPRGRLPPGTKTVALTFDDGPGEWTPDVLRVLHNKNAHATFFVVGRRAGAQPKTVKHVLAAGHLIGNHSWSHPFRTEKQGWTSAGLTPEIQRTQSRVRDITGSDPCFFRPPGGVLRGVGGPSRRADLSVALWSVDTRDWSGQQPGNRTYAATIRRRARAGLTEKHPVILLHDGGGYRGQTVAALPGIIDDYRAAGYIFVTLDGRT